jgi:hypothetical protein
MSAWLPWASPDAHATSAGRQGLLLALSAGAQPKVLRFSVRR